MAKVKWLAVLALGAALTACGGSNSSNRSGGGDGGNPIPLPTDPILLRVSDGEAKEGWAITVRDLGSDVRASLETDADGLASLPLDGLQGPLLVVLHTEEVAIPYVFDKPWPLSGWTVSLTPVSAMIHGLALQSLRHGDLARDMLADDLTSPDMAGAMDADWWLSDELDADARALRLRLATVMPPVQALMVARFCQGLLDQFAHTQCRNPLFGPSEQDYYQATDTLVAETQNDLHAGLLAQGDFSRGAAAVMDTAPMIRGWLPSRMAWLLKSEIGEQAMPVHFAGEGLFPHADLSDLPVQAEALAALLSTGLDPAGEGYGFTLESLVVSARGIGTPASVITADITGRRHFQGEHVALSGELSLDVTDGAFLSRTLSGQVLLGDGGEAMPMGPASVEVLSTGLEFRQTTARNDGTFELSVSGLPLLVRASRGDDVLYAMVGADEFDSWVTVSPLSDAAVRSLVAQNAGNATVPAAWRTHRPALVAGYYRDMGALARQIAQRAIEAVAATGVADDVPTAMLNPFFSVDTGCQAESLGAQDQGYCLARVVAAMGSCSPLSAELGIDCDGGRALKQEAGDTYFGMVQTQLLHLPETAWLPQSITRIELDNGEHPPVPIAAAGTEVRVMPLGRHTLTTVAIQVLTDALVDPWYGLYPPVTLVLDNPEVLRRNNHGFGTDSTLYLLQQGQPPLTGRFIGPAGEVGTFSTDYLFLGASPVR